MQTQVDCSDEFGSLARRRYTLVHSLVAYSAVWFAEYQSIKLKKQDKQEEEKEALCWDEADSRQMRAHENFRGKSFVTLSQRPLPSSFLKVVVLDDIFCFHLYHIKHWKTTFLSFSSAAGWCQLFLMFTINAAAADCHERKISHWLIQRISITSVDGCDDNFLLWPVCV